MATDTRRVVVGALLLFVSTVLLMGAGPLALTPGIVGGIAVLGLAAGALAFGTSEDGRPV